MTWTIIIAKANREKRLAEALGEAGHSAFLPLKRTWRTLYAKPSTVGYPVFPGYVFAVIQPHDIHAFHVDGASRILAVPPALQEMVDSSILAWQIAERYGEFDDFQPLSSGAGRGAKAKPRTRNRRTRKIKRLFRTIVDLHQAEQVA